MKNRDLIILLIVFGIVVLFSFSITQQSQKALSLTEKEITVLGQAESVVPTAYSAQVSSLPSAILPLVRSGITIIPVSSIESNEELLRSPKRAAKGANSLSSSNVYSSVEEQQEIPRPSGITEIGKRPAPKETQEMNSSGIVMY